MDTYCIAAASLFSSFLYGVRNALPLPDDTLLLRHIAAGDEAAFRTLYDRHSDAVFNTILHLLQHREDAEEATQDAFVEVHRAAENFKGDAQVSTWLYRIAVNRSLDRLRQRQSKKQSIIARLFGTAPEGFGAEELEHPAAHTDSPDAALYAEIQRLPERQRAAVVLVYLEGLPQREVAEILSLNLKAVESLLSRAKATLRSRLKPKESTPLLRLIL